MILALFGERPDPIDTLVDAVLGHNQSFLTYDVWPVEGTGWLSLQQVDDVRREPALRVGGETGRCTRGQPVDGDLERLVARRRCHLPVHDVKPLLIWPGHEEIRNSANGFPVE